MNTLDIVFCVILGFLGLRGIFRGLVKEIASILGLILGFVLANTYHAQLAAMFENFPGGPGMAKLAAYLAIFLGVVAVVFLLASLIRKLLQMIMLGWVDSIGGGALGLFKGALLCSIIVMALTAFLPSKSPMLTESKIMPYVNTFNTMLSNALPKEMRDQFLIRSQELQQEWEKRVVEKLKEMKGTPGGKE
ncbi:membrane protein required for colicin V production [Desulfomicrobium macestii]|uniref:Membrane protein required for colicin V production n=1 Tax=Desulfomicrobium macestii TaxID=90731 RepID=A0ABR9H5J6_9BACT|nr:CvpA family protein [Desulfomicrobium macestii]MBE1425995.1 membrane protein required for colicin V production [Desulfomicrobium macestii]